MHIFRSKKQSVTKAKPADVEMSDASQDGAVKCEASPAAKEGTDVPKTSVITSLTSGARTLSTSSAQKIIILATQPSSNSSKLASLIGDQSTSCGTSGESSSSAAPTKSVLIRSSNQGQSTPSSGSSFVSSITTDSLQGMFRM